MPQDVSPLIVALARKYRLDPAAVLAVARGEGGTRYGAVGDGGHSFGPFQLNNAGGVLTGRPGNHAAFANSPAGLAFALKGMADAGAAGLTGRAAVETIINKYERPADKATSIRNALARLGAAPTARPAAAPAVAAAPAAAGDDPRRRVLLSLLAQRRSGSSDRSPVLAALANAGARPQAPAAPLTTQTPHPAPGPVAAQEQTSGGLTPDFQERLNAMIAASGGRLSVTSGYRSPERQAQLYAAALKKYGSEAAARKWVAPPGRSKHNHGIAADLAGDLAWARRNAARFGLHFPLPHEGWHVEPLGSRG